MVSIVGRLYCCITDRVCTEHEGRSYQFSLVRVESPLVLVINGRKAGRELQAGVQMSTFTITD